MTNKVSSRTLDLYMGAAAPLAQLPNGALTNAAAQAKLQKTTYRSPEFDNVAPGVTVIGGHGFVNITLIEGDDGLIVYDTGEVLDDGERFLTEIRKISAKPIVAIIYSHVHYVHGTAALIGKGEGVRIIGHPQLNTNLAAGGAGSLYAAIAPLQNARTLQQFNHFQPESGPEACAGIHINFGRSGTLAVNTPVEDGQHMTIAGVEMQFFTRFGSDSDDCLTVLLPKTGVVLNNLFWPFMPNIYTLRGSKFRDPREWRDGLKLIRSLKPKALANTHARAVKGAEAVADALDAVIDGLSAILDQTLRGMLKGLGPDDLREFVKLPAHLAEHPNLAEIYGEISHFGPYLHNAAIGWFDGDAATINRLPPHQQAERLVDAMGGKAAVLKRAREALDAGQYAWCSELVTYLYRLDPADKSVRALKADVLIKLSHVTPAQTTRSWYIAHARALKGEVQVPRLSFTNTRVLALAPIKDSMEYYGVRVDPALTADVDKVVALEVTDRKKTHAWHLRRGVVEVVENIADCRRPPELVIATDYDNWLRFFTCRRTLSEFLQETRIVKGTHADADKFFSAFDFYTTDDNVVIPQANKS